MTVTLAVEGDTAKAPSRRPTGQPPDPPRPADRRPLRQLGTVARLGEGAELPTGAEAFMLRGEYRARLGSGQADIAGLVRQG